MGNGVSGVATNKTPVDVDEISNASKIYAGESYTCALLDDNTVRCWGYGSYGQMGNGILVNEQSTPASYVSDISSAISLDAGEAHICALLQSGQVKCWGAGGLYRLGNGVLADSSIPVSVLNISNAIDVSADAYFGCALLIDGSVSCWGRGSYYSLGTSDTSDKATPSVIESFSTW